MNHDIEIMILTVLILFGAAFCLSLLALFVKKLRREALMKHLKAKKLMKDNEVEFFHRLVRALPQYNVFPQVALNALLETKGFLPTDDYYYLRNLFDKKIADYVICDRQTLEVIAIVELDDKTHNKAKDAKRDEMLHAAGYNKLLRFESKAKPSEQEIAALL